MSRTRTKVRGEHWERAGCGSCGVAPGEPCSSSCPVEGCGCPTHAAPDDRPDWIDEYLENIADRFDKGIGMPHGYNIPKQVRDECARLIRGGTPPARREQERLEAAMVVAERALQSSVEAGDDGGFCPICTNAPMCCGEARAVIARWIRERSGKDLDERWRIYGEAEMAKPDTCPSCRQSGEVVNATTPADANAGRYRFRCDGCDYEWTARRNEGPPTSKLPRTS